MLCDAFIVLVLVRSLDNISAQRLACCRPSTYGRLVTVSAALRPSNLTCYLSNDANPPQQVARPVN